MHYDAKQHHSSALLWQLRHTSQATGLGDIWAGERGERCLLQACSTHPYERVDNFKPLALDSIRPMSLANAHPKPTSTSCTSLNHHAQHQHLPKACTTPTQPVAPLNHPTELSSKPPLGCAVRTAGPVIGPTNIPTARRGGGGGGGWGLGCGWPQALS